MSHYPPQDDKSKSTLYQMQRMFAYLQDSDRQYYDPVPYAKSLTWEGEPTNVNVMQDASDYVSNMFLHIGRQLQVGGWVGWLMSLRLCTHHFPLHPGHQAREVCSKPVHGCRDERAGCQGTLLHPGATEL